MALRKKRDLSTVETVRPAVGSADALFGHSGKLLSFRNMRAYRVVPTSHNRRSRLWRFGHDRVGG
jgi:hypothetical protein